MASAIGSALLSTALQALGNIAISEFTNNRTDRAVDRQNEYNLPVNQVERMKAAGLNPAALSMQNGMSIGGNISASPNAYVNPSIPDLLSGASGSLLNLINAEDVRSTRSARINEIQANTKLALQNAENVGINSESQLILNKYLEQKQIYELEGQKRRNDLDLWQVNSIKTGIKKMFKDMEKTDSDIKVNFMSLDVMLAEISDLKASAGLKTAQTEESEMHTALEGAQRDVAEQEANYYSDFADLKIREFQENIRKIAAEADVSEKDVYFYLFRLEKDFRPGIQDSPVGSINRGKMQGQINEEFSKQFGY